MDDLSEPAGGWRPNYNAVARGSNVIKISKTPKGMMFFVLLLGIALLAVGLMSAIDPTLIVGSATTLEQQTKNIKLRFGLGFSIAGLLVLLADMFLWYKNMQSAKTK